MPQQNHPRFVDLHTHSTASDGCLNPTELINLAISKQLSAIALTDHDTVAGIAEAAKVARASGVIQLIPAIEVSAKSPLGTLHILGLDIDETSPALSELCQNLRDARNERNPKILAKLAKMGINITIGEVENVAIVDKTDSSPVISRVHIAEVLMRKGLAKSISHAFTQYIGIEGDAYVDKEKFTPSEVITAIHHASGVAVLAHPGLVEYDNASQLTDLLQNLTHQGLDGIEIYHSSHSPSQTRQFLDLARKYSLAISGGSDFHGRYKPNVNLGLPRVPITVLESLRITARDVCNNSPKKTPKA